MAAANTKMPPYEGVFIFHDGRFWQVRLFSLAPTNPFGSEPHRGSGNPIS